MCGLCNRALSAFLLLIVLKFAYEAKWKFKQSIKSYSACLGTEGKFAAHRD
jgi:hypothetical protein